MVADRAVRLRPRRVLARAEALLLVLPAVLVLVLAPMLLGQGSLGFLTGGKGPAPTRRRRPPSRRRA